MKPHILVRKFIAQKKLIGNNLNLATRQKKMYFTNNTLHEIYSVSPLHICLLGFAFTILLRTDGAIYLFEISLFYSAGELLSSSLDFTSDNKMAHQQMIKKKLNRKVVLSI